MASRLVNLRPTFSPALARLFLRFGNFLEPVCSRISPFPVELAIDSRDFALLEIEAKTHTTITRRKSYEKYE
jgi:hypothetical protein